jgi:hypothetical protein
MSSKRLVISFKEGKRERERERERERVRRNNWNVI